MKQFPIIYLRNILPLKPSFLSFPWWLLLSGKLHLLDFLFQETEIIFVLAIVSELSICTDCSIKLIFKVESSNEMETAINVVLIFPGI